MKTKVDYQALALKIVPPSSHRSVTQLRSMIADTLEKEVSSALTKQKEQEFPDLAVTRKELEEQKWKLNDEAEKMKRKHKEIKDELDNRESQLMARERKLQNQEVNLQNLLKAFESYEKWLQGDGEIDDNGRRFAALQRTYNEYKNQKEKK